jgi:4-amino-4-deoxy-L-arabinose transferase-like glycosyltransferase
MSLVTPALPSSATHAAATAPPRRAHLLAWVDRFGLAAILVGFLILGFWYSLAIPPFETPDETYHYAFARRLAQGHGLPVQSVESTGPWEQEGSQAPLYYWIVGRLTAAIGQDDFDQVAIRNPRSNMGDPLYPGNKNRMLYSAAPRPLVGTNLALHVARWVSLALGALTIWCVALTARRAFGPGSRLALLPPLLVAVIPQFVFISASCSNDSMVIAASAAVVAWLARLLARETRIPLWEWGVLGVLLGLAALSKLQGLGLFVLAAGVGVAIAWRQRDPWLPLRALLPVALPALAIAGWWYWRNHALYNDWTGLANLVRINGLRTEPLEWGEFWLEFRGLRYSFWGLFGWFNLLLPQWVYTVLDLFSLAAVVGLIPALWAGRRRAAAWSRVRWLLAAWALLSAALVLYWMNRATGSQGRLFFPAIGAAVILFVIGLETWLAYVPVPVAAGLRSVPPLLLLGSTLYAGAWLFPASYGLPQPVAAAPAGAQRLDLVYGEGVYGEGEAIELLAIEPPPGRYYPGDQAPLTLYLRAPAALTHNYELFIQLLDEHGEVVGNVTTHPGWGRNPTRLWTPGAIYADSYTVQVRRAIDRRSPLLARVYTGFVDPADPELAPLTARDRTGQEITPFVASVPLLPFSPPTVDDYGLTPVAAQFDAGLTLAGVQAPAAVAAGAPLTVTVLWEASAPPEQDYTAFVHIVGPDGAQIAGHDQAPGGDRYPTHAWATGDRVVTEFAPLLPETTPPGAYGVWLGLYAADSGGAARLPVVAAGGLPVAHDMVQIGAVEVMRPEGD